MNKSSPEQDVKTQLVVGDPAPDVTVNDHLGNRVTLSSLWQSQPRVLLFIRHFG